MKKKHMILASVLVAIIAVFCTLYAINNRSNNEPPTGITDRTAIEIAQKIFDEKVKETLTNFENPKVEEVVFDSEHHMVYFDENDKPSYEPLYKIKGKNLYKITFNTTQDGLLGPAVVYVDKSNGKLIGIDYRY